MKKLYFLLFTFLITAISFGQIEVFNLAGGGALPNGWASVNNVTTNDIDRTSYYLLDAGDPSDEITSDVYDLSPAISADISFDIRSFGSGVHNSAVVEISYDGGATYSQAETSPITTTGYTTYSFALNSFTSQVKFRFTNSGISGRGVRFQNIKLIAITADPFVSVSSPADFSTFPSGTTSVDVVFTIGNTEPGDQVDINVNGNITTNITSPFPVSTTDGQSYSVTVELKRGATILDFESVDFNVEYPCDLQIGSIITTCDSSTSNVDTYTTFIDFTGGGTSNYTILTGGVGSLDFTSGNPSIDASGTLAITGVDEGVDFTVTFTGDASNSSCSFDRDIFGPVCFIASCANPGDIIITEVMRNPNAVSDSNGEYFEIYNASGVSIDFQGWTIKDDASVGETHTVSSSFVVPAGQYAVFTINGNSLTNGGIIGAYSYNGDISLGNSNPDGIIIECSESVIDQVVFDGTFPPASAGISMELTTQATSRNNINNDDGANWALAITPYGDGDIGTPGAMNDNSSALSTDAFDSVNFSFYPNPTSTGFVTIKTSDNSPISVTLYNILGKQVKNMTVSDNKINVSELSNGVYFVKITQNNASVTKKLIIN